MKIIPNTFKRYEISAAEQRSGSIFNDSQLAVLHNLRTDYAEQKLNLVFTPEKVLDFAQQEAILAGCIQLLGYLIDTSAESQKAVINPPEVQS